MKRFPFLLVLTAAIGCGYDYATFDEEWAQVKCDKYEECDYFTIYWDKEGCLESSGEPEDTAWSCDGWDGKLAKECLDGWSVLTCDDLANGDTPDACLNYCSNLF